MITGKKVKALLQSDFVLAKRNIEMSVGDVIRNLRELNELSQNELAERTQIPQSTISGLEKNRIKLGVERAKVLARALHVHPAVILFPGWDTKTESLAS